MNGVVFTEYGVLPYALLPRSPLIVGTTRLEKRLGAIVSVKVKTDTNSFVVHSDLAPLQGFSEDGLQEGLDALGRALPRWLDHELPLIDLRKGLSELWEAFVDVEPDLNALSWCMFALCVQTHSRVRGLRPAEILGGKTQNASVEEVGLERLADAYPGDAVAPKLKFHSEADLSRILEIAGNRSIRLDSNGIFSAADVVRIAKTLPLEKIVYWEEPTRDSDAITALRALGIRVAKDESLLSADWEEQICDAYVVKPTVLGWKKTDAVLRKAKANNMELAISTAYESSIGRAFLRELALSLGPNTTLGLGPKDLFSNDINIDEIADAI